MLIKDQETVQAYIELTGNVVASVRLEYTTDGGHVWKTESTEAGAEMIYTGTGASPLTSGTVCQEFVKNISGKTRVYRWRCTSYTSGTLVTYISKQELNLGKWLVPNSQDIYFIWDDEEPTSGADGDGAGYAGHGSFYIDTSSDGRVYYNAYTKDMTNWTAV